MWALNKNLIVVDNDFRKSNAIFKELERWESYLKAEKINIPKLLKEAEFEDNEPHNALLSGDQIAAPKPKKTLSKEQASKNALSKTFSPEKPEIKSLSAPTRRPSTRLRGPSR